MIDYSYDAMGRLVAKTDANSHVTQFVYDGNDNVVTIVDREEPEHRPSSTT